MPPEPAEPRATLTGEDKNLVESMRKAPCSQCEIDLIAVIDRLTARLAAAEAVVEKAVADEREACAKLCETLAAALTDEAQTDHATLGAVYSLEPSSAALQLEGVAEEIRARSDALAGQRERGK